jgi:hypothetical protein
MAGYGHYYSKSSCTTPPARSNPRRCILSNETS